MGRDAGSGSRRRRLSRPERPGAGGSHRDALAAVAVTPDQRERLARYLDLLERWNRRVNLTGPASPRERVTRLIADAVAVAHELEPGPLGDVGSGNGAPGLVLALLRSDLPVTLLEPRQRRAAFLREAADTLGLANVAVRRARHDAVSPERFQTLTLKGLELPLSELAPLLHPGGSIWRFGGAAGPTAGFALERELPLDGATLRRYRHCFT